MVCLALAVVGAAGVAGAAAAEAVSEVRDEAEVSGGVCGCDGGELRLVGGGVVASAGEERGLEAVGFGDASTSGSSGTCASALEDCCWLENGKERGTLAAILFSPTASEATFGTSD